MPAVRGGTRPVPGGPKPSLLIRIGRSPTAGARTVRYPESGGQFDENSRAGIYFPARSAPGIPRTQPATGGRSVSELATLDAAADGAARASHPCLGSLRRTEKVNRATRQRRSSPAVDAIRSRAVGGRGAGGGDARDAPASAGGRTAARQQRARRECRRHAGDGPGMVARGRHDVEGVRRRPPPPDVRGFRSTAKSTPQTRSSDDDLRAFTTE